MRRFFCTFIFVLLFTSLSFAADWAQFNGPNGDNKSSDTGLLKKWSEGGPKLLWTADFIGTGWSSVTISGDRIYTSGNVNDRSMVFCIDKDGNKIWAEENGPAHTEGRTYPGTRGTPAVDGNFVYDASPLGEAACFDAKTGKKIWNRNLLKDYDAPMPRWILGHSVVVDGDNIVCMVGGAKALAVALDKRTGTTALEYAGVGLPTSYVTPYFFEFEGIRVLTVMSNETIEGYDAKSTKPLFSIPWKNMRSTTIPMPIYRNGHLLVSSGYDNGTKLFKLAKKSDGTLSATEVWYQQKLDNHHGGLVLVGDYVYGAAHKGSWGSIHVDTGELGYFERGAGAYGSIHFAEGLLYGLTEKGTAFLYKPEPERFVELGRFELPNEASGASWAHPVVCNGKLYLRHAQYLYCYDVKE